MSTSTEIDRVIRGFYCIPDSRLGHIYLKSYLPAKSVAWKLWKLFPWYHKNPGQPGDLLPEWQGFDISHIPQQSFGEYHRKPWCLKRYTYTFRSITESRDVTKCHIAFIHSSSDPPMKAMELHNITHIHYDRSSLQKMKHILIIFYHRMQGSFWVWAQPITLCGILLMHTHTVVTSVQPTLQLGYG